MAQSHSAALPYKDSVSAAGQGVGANNAAAVLCVMLTGC